MERLGAKWPSAKPDGDWFLAGHSAGFGSVYEWALGLGKETGVKFGKPEDTRCQR